MQQYVGSVGTGKTHLSIALGMACCQHNYRVRFVTAAELVTLLVEAQQQGRLARKLDQLARFDVIICDELGYVPLDKAGADLLFGFISQRYERRSLVVTTNLPFARWSEVFLDPTAAAAVIDRIIHHSRVFQTTGSSYRLAGREAEPGGDGRRKGANALMSPDRARTTMRWGDAPSGAPRSHPLTTSAPIRAQRGDRREPVRYKRETTYGGPVSDASGSVCRQTHPARPTVASQGTCHDVNRERQPVREIRATSEQSPGKEVMD